MNWIVGNIKWIMLVAGLLTCTMFYAAIAPEAALQSTFGHSLQGPVAEIVVRNWGVLITLMGALLIYGAFNPVVRPLVLTAAGLSKAWFVALILIFGRPFLVDGKVGVAVVSDVLQIALFTAYLIAARGPLSDPPMQPPGSARGS